MKRTLIAALALLVCAGAANAALIVVTTDIGYQWSNDDFDVQPGGVMRGSLGGTVDLNGGNLGGGADPGEIYSRTASAVININSGTVEGKMNASSGVWNIKGGTLAATTYFQTGNNATINIWDNATGFVYGLQGSEVPVGYGVLTQAPGDLNYLGGTLEDGTAFSVRIHRQWGTSTFNLIQGIPEPASMALLGIGGLVVLIRRRK